MLPRAQTTRWKPSLPSQHQEIARKWRIDSQCQSQLITWTTSLQRTTTHGTISGNPLSPIKQYRKVTAAASPLQPCLLLVGIASSRWNSRERPQKSSQNMLRSFYLNTDYTDFTDKLLKSPLLLHPCNPCYPCSSKNISVVICGFIEHGLHGFYG